MRFCLNLHVYTCVYVILHDYYKHGIIINHKETLPTEDIHGIYLLVWIKIAIIMPLIPIISVILCHKCSRYVSAMWLILLIQCVVITALIVKRNVTMKIHIVLICLILLFRRWRGKPKCNERFTLIEFIWIKLLHLGCLLLS